MDLLDIEKRVTEIVDNYDTHPNPYHNALHMKTVWQIAKVLWSEEVEPEIELDLESDYLALMLACLFHDIGHSGGLHPDYSNVAMARIAVDNILEYPNFDILPQVRHMVDQAISCTEYPFVEEPTTLVERILRDADILYPAFVGDPKIVMEDLRQELKDVSIDQMLDNQLKFLKSAKLYTTAGQKMWDDLAEVYYLNLVEYAWYR